MNLWFPVSLCFWIAGAVWGATAPTASSFILGLALILAVQALCYFVLTKLRRMRRELSPIPAVKVSTTEKEKPSSEGGT